MPRITSVEGARVYSASGRRLGRVMRVLFHPAQPRVVGLQVLVDPLLFVIRRRPRYVRLDECELTAEDVRLHAKRLPSDRSGEEVLGCSWDETVVWRGMPVRSSDDERVGVVYDAVFGAAGDLGIVRITTGVVGDVAVGRLEVPAELVRGFSGDAVVVEPGYRDIGATGGAAKAAAAGVSRVKAQGERLAEGAREFGSAAAGAVRRSFRQGLGRRAIDAVKALTKEDE